MTSSEVPPVTVDQVSGILRADDRDALRRKVEPFIDAVEAAIEHADECLTGVENTVEGVEQIVDLVT